MVKEMEHGRFRGRWDGYRVAASAAPRECAQYNSWFTTLYDELKLPPDHSGGLGVGYGGHCFADPSGTVLSSESIVEAERLATRDYLSHYEHVVGRCGLGTSRSGLLDRSAVVYRERVVEPLWDAKTQGIVVAAHIEIGNTVLQGGAIWRGRDFYAKYWDLGLAVAMACTWMTLPDGNANDLPQDAWQHFERSARMMSAALATVGVQEIRMDVPSDGVSGLQEEVSLWIRQSELNGWWSCLGDF